MTGARHIEIFRYLPDGTRVPKADSSNDCDSRHSRTIGPKGSIRDTLRVSLSADSGVNFNQESPERDLFYETFLAHFRRSDCHFDRGRSARRGSEPVYRSNDGRVIVRS